jgi:hypothetical protein
MIVVIVKGMRNWEKMLPNLKGRRMSRRENK